MRISFISTLFNEEFTVENFLYSILIQSKKPDEIIIVDGGSEDKTVAIIRKIETKFKKDTIPFILLTKKGNRSVGRNEAIKHATGDIIVCSDAGNILDKDWIKNITEPFKNKEKNKKVDVVAGYYKGVAENVFQKCVIPYALIMLDKVDPDNFLPATRSIAFTKAIWEKAGGFNEKLSHNEDYVFARKLKSLGAKIAFAKEAVVYWKPRNSFHQAFVMMYRFAYGDAEARIIRPKVIFIFVRYAIMISLLILAILMRSTNLFSIFLILLILYGIWAISKNYRYVKQWQAVYILPLMQVVADWAVLKGTTSGLLKQKIKYR